MRMIEDVETLEGLYGAPNPRSLSKVADHLTPLYREWIGASRFAIVSTVGPDGTDASPRGEDGPVARIVDDRTLWLPDWRGNNRLDTLRNIVRDGRASLMFLVPGSGTVIRINGTAALTDDADACASFARGTSQPRSVIVFRVAEVYFQCAKAVMRAGLWSADPVQLPSAGDFLREAEAGFDGRAYDDAYPERARNQMW